MNPFTQKGSPGDKSNLIAAGTAQRSRPRSGPGTVSKIVAITATFGCKRRTTANPICGENEGDTTSDAKFIGNTTIIPHLMLRQTILPRELRTKHFRRVSI
ncbi:hypothetical protein ABZX51_001758 [Aspergillus tubingensis]